MISRNLDFATIQGCYRTWVPGLLTDLTDRDPRVVADIQEVALKYDKDPDELLHQVVLVRVKPVLADA
jgi:hypothetical protein